MVLIFISFVTQILLAMSTVRQDGMKLGCDLDLMLRLLGIDLLLRLCSFSGVYLLRNLARRKIAMDTFTDIAFIKEKNAIQIIGETHDEVYAA